MLLKILEHHNLHKTKCVDLIQPEKKIPVVNNLDSET